MTQVIDTEERYLDGLVVSLLRKKLKRITDPKELAARLGHKTMDKYLQEIISSYFLEIVPQDDALLIFTERDGFMYKREGNEVLSLNPTPLFAGGNSFTAVLKYIQREDGQMTRIPVLFYNEKAKQRFANEARNALIGTSSQHISVKDYGLVKLYYYAKADS